MRTTVFGIPSTVFGIGTNQTHSLCNDARLESLYLRTQVGMLKVCTEILLLRTID